MSLHTQDTLLVLRVTRLGRVPPAQYSTEILTEAGIPTLVVEFGEVNPPRPEPHSVLRKIRLSVPAFSFLPKALRSGAQWLSSLRQIAGIIKGGGKPRFIVAHGLHEQTIALLLNRRWKIPFAVHVHEIADWGELRGFNRFLFFFEGAALRAADFTIFPEKTRQKIYVERYQLRNPSHLVFNCPRRRRSFPPRDLRKDLGLDKSAFLVGYLGGIGKQNFLLETARAVATIPEAHFVIMGGWGDANFRAQLQGPRVHIVGPVEDKWPYLSACDLGLCLYDAKESRMQHQATASNKLTESIAAGLPVLVRPTPDFEEFIRQFPVGYVVPSLDTEGIALAIRHCMNSPQRAVWAREALQFHASTLNYEAQFAGVLPIFQKIFALKERQLA